MCGPEKFLETQLSSIKDFHDTINDEDLSEEDYEHAKQIWDHFGIKTLQSYHDHYLLSDVLLLTDVFENFRDSIYDELGLDPLHLITLPSLACSSAMKYTGVELNLITDPDVYWIIEKKHERRYSHHFASPRAC